MVISIIIGNRDKYKIIKTVIRYQKFEFLSIFYVSQIGHDFLCIFYIYNINNINCNRNDWKTMYFTLVLFIILNIQNERLDSDL